ncbi:MAG: PEP-CTERM sorting domain-containing protein, partial [Planctomycetota bacterium]
VCLLCNTASADLFLTVYSVLYNDGSAGQALPGLQDGELVDVSFTMNSLDFDPSQSGALSWYWGQNSVDVTMTATGQTSGNSASFDLDLGGANFFHSFNAGDMAFFNEGSGNDFDFIDDFYNTNGAFAFFNHGTSLAALDGSHDTLDDAAVYFGTLQGIDTTTTISQVSTGFSDTLTFVTGQTHLNAIPEPTSAILLGLGGCAFLARRRRS